VNTMEGGGAPASAVMFVEVSMVITMVVFPV
jgi:hypothetical protein